jgi:Fe2+ or Zn2+ uptake regulation protein
MADPLIDRLRSRGWRLTPQRRAVAWAFAGDHTHLSADEVVRRARAVLPDVSQATVYNTLNDLAAMGELRVVSLRRGPVQYDANADPHDHLVCTECGRVLDLALAGKDSLHVPDSQRHGYSVDTMDVVVRGTCPDCRP